MPSLLLDRRGKLVTEFFAEERREIISIADLPKYMLEAVITKEDRTFFSHPGFSVKGILRAAWNIFAGHYFSGGSTISQQVAGNLYDDRSITTLGRKLSELWWSLQLEKKRTKLEILEIYLNNSQFGHGNYGVESASQFYFGRSASNLSLAEATLLIVHLSNPVTRSMINYPNRARGLQEKLIADMANEGYIDAAEAYEEFSRFWASYVPLSPGNITTHTERTNRAPEFTELIRRRFEELFYGSPDLYRDGFVIHSGLDLVYQQLAEELLDETAERLGNELEQNDEYVRRLAAEVLIPSISLLGTVFGIEGVQFSNGLESAKRIVDESFLVPLVLLDEVFGAGDLRDRIEFSPGRERKVVVGELVAVDNETGHILALASRRSGDDTLIGVSERLLNIGSIAGTFAYAAGIDSRAITPASMIYDSPVYVATAAGPVAFSNPTGVYRGPIPAWRAVASNVNSPLITIAEKTGLSALSKLVSAFLSDAFGPEPVLPANAGLAVDGTRATILQVARAFSSFPRGGTPPVLLEILYIEDRNGVVIYDNEQAALRDLSHTAPVVSSNGAYLVSDALSRSLTSGSLARRAAEVGGLERSDYGAASGSTPDWSDAWTIGFSSKISTAVWFGLEDEDQILGQFQGGAAVAGPVWTKFMKTIHEQLPPPDPETVPSGIIHRRVCAVSGQLPTESCLDGVEVVPFLAGTEPSELCTYHDELIHVRELMERRIRDRIVIEAPLAGLLLRPPVETIPAGGSEDPDADATMNPYFD